MLRKGPETSISESQSACWRAIERSVGISVYESFPGRSAPLWVDKAFRHEIGHRDRKEPGLRIGEALPNPGRFLLNLRLDLARSLSQGRAVALKLLAFLRRKAGQLQLDVAFRLTE